jgi:hypothetical protein
MFERDFIDSNFPESWDEVGILGEIDALAPWVPSTNM